MSGEVYNYDDPVGIYGFDSKQRLAHETVREFGRYERSLDRVDTADNIMSEAGVMMPCPDQSGLSTLVEERASTGYALAAAPSYETERQGVNGIFYTVELNERPEVTKASSIFITTSRLLNSRWAHDADVDELVNRFNKPELEILMRMAGKLATGMHLIEQLPDKTTDMMLTYGGPLKNAFAVEPQVMGALQQYNLDDLAAQFPNTGDQVNQVTMDTIDDIAIEHIMEWPELLEAAETRFRRESDSNLPKASIAIQDIVGESHYVMRFQAEYGRLTKLQLLCWDGCGNGNSQEFNLRVNSGDDDLEHLQIKSSWNKIDLLTAVQQGEPITNEVYKGYLKTASDDPDMDISLTLAEIIHLDEERKKRPAA